MKKTFITISLMLAIALQLVAQQSNTITLDLQNPMYPTSFNFIGNGYWDKTYVDVGYTWFNSQVFSFSHLIEGAGSAYGGYAWNGFTVCNSGDNTDHSAEGSWFMNYEWGCMAGGGIKTDAEGNILTDENDVVLVDDELPYMVGFWHFLIEPEWWWLCLQWELNFLDEPTHCFQILLDEEEEYEAVGVYVNNHPWTYYANLHGFGLARPLNQSGDYFKLIFHGINPDGTESGKKVEYFLAKFENGQLHQSTNWEWVDLSALGEIGGIYCTMESTDAGQYGPNSPMYFCMDKLQVKTKEVFVFVPVENITTNIPDSIMVNVPLTLTGTVIPDNATNQTILWSVQDAGTTGATITDNTFIATDAGTATIRATIENGLTEDEDYIQDFTIDVKKEIIGIEENELSNVQVYSYRNSIYINTVETWHATSLQSVEIFDSAGRLVYQSAINASETVIHLNGATGIYYVRLVSQTNGLTITEQVLLY